MTTAMSTREPDDVHSHSGRVRATPPSRRDGYWRVSCYDEDGRRIAQTTGGRTRESAARRVAEEERRLNSVGLPGARASRGDDLFDFFIDDSRPKFPHNGRRDQTWSAGYRRQADGLIERYLRPVLGSRPLTAWSAALAYRALDACPTNYVVEKARRILSSVVTVGLANGFLGPEQAAMHRVTVPLRIDMRPSRREQPPARGDAPALVPLAEVPGVSQVHTLAEAIDAVPAPCRAWWTLWVYLLAYGGLRVGELMALTAAEVLDPTRQLLAVTWQVEEGATGSRLVPPKNHKSRLSVVCGCTPQGFPLWQRLVARAEVALDEQRLGANPRALIAPAPRGGWWSRSNFRARCFVPAALHAGWQTTSWQGPCRLGTPGHWRYVTTDRRDFVHTAHSLRHHYACTARDFWHWSGAELCANGGWSDPAFVIARYYGLTPEVHATALAKQEQAARR
jgi:integrase